MKDYKLGIIGLGGMGNWHRELITPETRISRDDPRMMNPGSEGIEHLSVKGAYDIDPKRQQFARDNGIIAYDSLEALLGDKEIDIILVAVPNHLHKPMVIKALEAGKNVVCEKPVALSPAEFQDMIDASKKAGKVFAVHQNRRWDEDYLAAKQVYEKNDLEIFRIESRVHGSRGIPHDWRAEPDKGGGMVLDWGVHIMDQALQMVQGKIKRVYADFTYQTNEFVEDGFFVDLSFDNGITYHLETSCNNFISLPRWYILGRNGSAVIETFGGDGKIVRCTDFSKNDAIPIKTAAGLTKTMAPRTKDTIKEEPLPHVKSDIRDYYKNIMAVIEGKETLRVSLESVMRNMKLLAKVFESAKTHKVLDFE